MDTDGILAVVLAEYQALRDEMRDKFAFHLQIYSIYTPGLLIFYGWMFAHELYDLVMLIPVFSFGLVLRVLWEQRAIVEISAYIREEIEGKKIPNLVATMGDGQYQAADYRNLWMAWQHCWQQTASKNPRPRFYLYSLLVLFFLLSALPAISYNVYSLLAPLFHTPAVSMLPVGALVPVLALNCSLSIYVAHHLCSTYQGPCK
ncbi:MAG TPA: hypothetical protein VMX94_02030 [Armatimonadota bacterium]|nr:hypothetical protein [Armatimonadota bacterium]